mmetsp:Transcript_25967/g.60621  ORF Transcript_25967/g.60621 Transcript_25967/m.60621 type:complete len:305 (-) Transcript_25967:158-1072(-)
MERWSQEKWCSAPHTLHMHRTAQTMLIHGRAPRGHCSAEKILSLWPIETTPTSLSASSSASLPSPRTHSISSGSSSASRSNASSYCCSPREARSSPTQEGALGAAVESALSFSAETDFFTDCSTSCINILLSSCSAPSTAMLSLTIRSTSSLNLSFSSTAEAAHSMCSGAPTGAAPVSESACRAGCASGRCLRGASLASGSFSSSSSQASLGGGADGSCVDGNCSGHDGASSVDNGILAATMGATTVVGICSLFLVRWSSSCACFAGKSSSTMCSMSRLPQLSQLTASTSFQPKTPCLPGSLNL